MEKYNLEVETIERSIIKRATEYIMNRYDGNIIELELWLTMYGVPFFTELYIDSVKDKFNSYVNHMIHHQLENAAKHIVYSTSAFLVYHSNECIDTYKVIKFLRILIKQQFEQFHVWCDVYAEIYKSERDIQMKTLS